MSPKSILHAESETQHLDGYRRLYRFIEEYMNDPEMIE